VDIPIHPGLQQEYTGKYFLHHQSSRDEDYMRTWLLGFVLAILLVLTG